MGVEIGWLKITKKEIKARVPLFLFPYQGGTTFIICRTAVGVSNRSDSNLIILQEPNETIGLSYYCHPCLCGTLVTLFIYQHASVLPRRLLYPVSLSQEGSVYSKVKGTDSSSTHARPPGISSVLDPVLEPTVSFAWGGVIHPGAWDVTRRNLFPLPGCRIKGPVKQQRHHMVYLCIHSTNRFHARCWENSLYNRVRVFCTREAWRLPGR